MEDQNQNNLNGAGDAESDIDKKQAEEYLNNWKRERADFINYKKDEAKRMEEFVKFANAAFIVELLDLLDDLYAAAGQVRNEGLDRTIKKFEDWLDKYKVEKIKVAGEKFDPLRHEAVESEEGGEKLEEVRAGYMMNGRVIRPARVKVIIEK